MLEYVVLRTSPALAIKREAFHQHVLNSESIQDPQILLVSEALESIAGLLADLVVGLGTSLYEQHVQPILRSGNPTNMIAYEIKMYHKNCSNKGLI